MLGGSRDIADKLGTMAGRGCLTELRVPQCENVAAASQGRGQKTCDEVSQNSGAQEQLRGGPATGDRQML